jgi:hypothetical protein
MDTTQAFPGLANSLVGFDSNAALAQTKCPRKLPMICLMSHRTRNDDNFLGEKDDVSAGFGNDGRMRAVAFGRLENLSAAERDSRYPVERFVFVQREMDFICNDTGSLHHARNVKLNPPCLELLERHSIRTRRDGRRSCKSFARCIGPADGSFSSGCDPTLR